MRRPWSVLAAFALVAVAALSGAACAGGASPAAAGEIVRSDAAREPADPAVAPQGAAAVAAFGADLYGVLARDPGNLVFSPYSAAIALAMTRAGAAGDTAVEMDAVLHADRAGDLHAAFNALEAALATRPGEYPFGDTTVELELSTANALWGQAGFDLEPAFLDRLAAEYGAGMRLVDYIDAREQARTAINAWVAGETNDRIPELIADGVLNERTRLVLTNAIYLKAPWLHRFDEGATAPAPFLRLDGTAVEAELMHLGASMRYGAGDGWQAVELPYVGEALSMLAIVPDAGTFDDFESTLDGETVQAVVDGLTGAHVQLGFPRFEFRTQAKLKPALAELGMPVAFTDAADFSLMSPEPLLIQDVVHEAFIAVDEEGTEAAAATAVIVGVTSAPAVSVELTVDRPFLFVIRDNETGAILFMGRIVDPTA